MAPKRRKKAGQTRMDAAVDQMSVLGFSKQLVRKTVTNLLKLYGDDGWKLIEEDAYRVLLDVILDEQETAQKHNLLENAPSYKAAAEDASLTNNAESSEAPLFLIEGVGNQESLKDANLDKNNLHSSPFDTRDDHSANKVNLQNSENATLLGCSSDAIHAPVNVTARRRKPCYGWISDDDTDDDHDTKISDCSGLRKWYPVTIPEEDWLESLLNVATRNAHIFGTF